MKENNLAVENLKSLTLLCVENNTILQAFYKSLLSPLFKKIIFAQNGADGYQKFLDNSIDIIITDYDMPVLKGLDMIVKIRQENKIIPIILASTKEELVILSEAFDLNIHSFIDKPLQEKIILQSIKDASNILITNDYLHDQKNIKLEKLEKQHAYSSYQEELTFAKELNILRNDFYYQMIDEKHISLVDFLYQPLDVISGDAYSARRIDKNRIFYLIVDGMGKGLSASLTAMLMTSFINHTIDKMIKNDSFSLDLLIDESMDYIKPILLNEESLSIDYILLDTAYDSLSYAKFAMPAMLLQDAKKSIIRIKSNNPPLSKWQINYVIDEYDIKDITKFLFYSDGIVENVTREEGKLYADFIEEDFKESYTREDLKTKCFEKVDEIGDDITLIFINRLALNDTLVAKKNFDSSLHEIDNAHAWYSQLWQEFTQDLNTVDTANLVFTELFMNAYEHGNLSISSELKHKLLEEDRYFEALEEREKDCSKKITVKVYKIDYALETYIITRICDEGNGFDTQILSKIFRNRAKFNGRGVFISRKNSCGIYYSAKGSSVLYLNKI